MRVNIYFISYEFYNFKVVICLFAFAGEFVAQFKYTLLLMPNGQMRITQGPAFDPESYESQYKIEDPEILVCFQLILLISHYN